MSKVHKTAKGSELPIFNYRGKDYLEVKYRLVWFREEKSEWSIETEMLSVTETSAYAKAVIRDEQGRIRSTGHKYENAKGFADFIEKAETGAIGRALALIGYGTQFCGDELDEGERIVDGPVEPRNHAPKLAPVKSAAEILDGPESNLGETLITVGQKFRGKKFKDCKLDDLRGYADWLCGKAKDSGRPLSDDAAEFVKLVDAYAMETGI